MRSGDPVVPETNSSRGAGRERGAFPRMADIGEFVQQRSAGSSATTKTRRAGGGGRPRSRDLVDHVWHVPAIVGRRITLDVHGTRSSRCCPRASRSRASGPLRPGERRAIRHRAGRTGARGAGRHLRRRDRRGPYGSSTSRLTAYASRIINVRHSPIGLARTVRLDCRLDLRPGSVGRRDHTRSDCETSRPRS